jgi:hypothetical protein
MRVLTSELGPSIPEPLRHWVDGGAPYRWVEAQRGRWNHSDWVDLLNSLYRARLGPVPEEALGRILEAARCRWDNLQRWEQAGEAYRWVEAHQGQWTHADWLALPIEITASGHGPMELEALGRLLERTRTEWQNLCRWRDQGHAQRWVEAHGGSWDHDDWLALLGMLQHSEFWPLNPARLGELLEEARELRANFQRWQVSGEAACWVESHQGQWTHSEWLLLVQGLQLSEYGPLDPAAIGREVEHAKVEYQNLQRWLGSDESRQWVDDHQGRSTGDDLRVLIRSLQRSQYGPIDPVSLVSAVRQLEAEWANLRRWDATAEPRRWVEDRQGRWDQRERQLLIDYLRRSAYWPINLAALDALLNRYRVEWWNLRRWQKSGLARLWLEAHRGRTRSDWNTLLETLRQSDFWPMELEALRKVVEGFRPALSNQAA